MPRTLDTRTVTVKVKPEIDADAVQEAAQLAARAFLASFAAAVLDGTETTADGDDRVEEFTELLPGHVGHNLCHWKCSEHDTTDHALRWCSRSQHTTGEDCLCRPARVPHDPRAYPADGQCPSGCSEHGDDAPAEVTLDRERLRRIATGLHVAHTEALESTENYAQAFAHDFATDYLWLCEEIGITPAGTVVEWLQRWDADHEEGHQKAATAPRSDDQDEEAQGADPDAESAARTYVEWLRTDLPEGYALVRQSALDVAADIIDRTGRRGAAKALKNAGRA